MFVDGISKLSKKLKFATVRGDANPAILDELKRLEPRLVFEDITTSTDHLGIIAFTNRSVEAVGEVSGESTDGIISGVMQNGGYLVVVDIGMKFPFESRRAATDFTTISILTPREAGFNENSWPKKILNDIRSQYPEIGGRERD